jgi:hypothetical protein
MNTIKTKYESYKEFRKTRSTQKAEEKAAALAAAKLAKKQGTKKRRVIKNAKVNGFEHFELD